MSVEIAALDLLVIGAGSGGMACARRAASYGVSVGAVESHKLGGTCVNVGCVPKKIMWWAGCVRDIIRDSKHYGMSSENSKNTFCWVEIKRRRDANIQRLNGIYECNLSKSDCKLFRGSAAFVGGNSESKYHKVAVDDKIVNAKHVVIASGGYPTPLGIPGEEFTITSDTFFELETQPQKVAIIGAGYIAVELAGVFNALGTESHLFVRQQHALRSFDDMLSSKLHEHMLHDNIQIHPGSVCESFQKDGLSGKLSVHLCNGSSFDGFDQILVAIGRSPQVESLNLAAVGINTRPSKHIIVDAYQSTNVPNIFALGDVSGQVDLTPMAIAAGRLLADRLFGNCFGAKADYTFVPTVVFAHPPLGTIGLTESKAKEVYGKDDIEIFTNTSVNLYYSVFDIPPEEKPKTHMKMICVKSQNLKVVGLHMIGLGVDEILQGFGVAIKMGATKHDFDSCVAIHPTAAEEVVTMPPWKP